MPLKRTNMLCATIGALALLPIGCMTPLAPSASTSSAIEPAAGAAEAATTSTATKLPDDALGTDADFASVLDKLAEVRAIDPAAEKQLIEKLRQTPAKSWPLVAEQFRSSLAYHEQLSAKKKTQRAATESGTPPSAAIGSLVDPRAAEPDEAASRAHSPSMHYAMQAPLDDAPAQTPAPAEFASDGPAYPIMAKPAAIAETKSHDLTTAVKHAAFEQSSVYASEPVASQSNDVSGDWQQLVEQAESNLSERVAASPVSTEEVHQHVSLRILRLLAGDTERALDPIPHISPAEQDYWSKQMFALATYMDHHSQPDDKRRAAASVTHLDEAVSNLRELGSLSLRNLAFCKNVYGYGAIEPYKADSFAAGEEVSLYVEVENYHSRSTEDGFCTLLGSSYELVDDAGERVAGGEFPDVDDCCRTRRRDFHIQYGLTLPSSLSAGKYRLKVVVKDRQSDKIGNASVEFEVRGSGVVAGQDKGTWGHGNKGTIE
jgi:hypothetical protein